MKKPLRATNPIPTGEIEKMFSQIITILQDIQENQKIIYELLTKRKGVKNTYFFETPTVDINKLNNGTTATLKDFHKFYLFSL